MNLFPPSSRPLQQRPHQSGAAIGTKSSKPARANVEWLVDTGAELGCVRHTIGSQFDLAATGASASPTSGGVGILIMNGLEAEFNAEDAFGVSHTLRATQSVAVKSNNAGSDILGMDQLASLNVTIEWDPQVQKGTLTITGKSGPHKAVPASTMSTPQIVDHGTWVDVGGVRVEKRHLPQRPVR